MNNNLLENAPLVSAFFGMLIAQGLKPFSSLISEKKFDFKMLVSNGGMPSSHTASVISLTTSIAMVKGMSSVEFAMAVVFSLVVIFDAMGIRRAAGRHAEVLNEWSRVLKDVTHNGVTEQNFKTLLGHSFSQVIGGAIVGIIVGILATNIVIGA